MKRKKGDNVIVIAGKDRGKTGKVVRVLREKERVIVDGINIVKKHQRPSKSNQKGQIIDKLLPIHISNIMLVDPKTNKRTRVGKKLVKGRYIRIAKKSGTIL
jgi:large subunit ribosomal protein L24